MKTLHRKKREKMKFTRTVPVSEVFYSIEGEGILTGFPTVFIRTFGCNFTCSGFSVPPGQDSAQVMIPIKSLDEFVPYSSGCDSIYSWSPSYKEFSEKYTVSALAEKLLSVLPSKAEDARRDWRVGRSRPVLSLTGGEPTLHQKFWTQFLQHSLMRGVNKLLIETNGAVPLGQEFLDALNHWMELSSGMVLWANSPKLSHSGEPWAKAINPEIIKQQHSVSDMQYFKFVTNGSPEDLAEIERAVAEYAAVVGPIREDQVLLMPVGGSLEQQKEMQKRVAEVCIANGYIYCGRVHVSIWGNCVGT